MLGWGVVRLRPWCRLVVIYRAGLLSCRRIVSIIRRASLKAERQRLGRRGLGGDGEGAEFLPCRMKFFSCCIVDIVAALLPPSGDCQEVAALGQTLMSWGVARSVGTRACAFSARDAPEGESFARYENVERKPNNDNQVNLRTSLFWVLPWCCYGFEEVRIAKGLRVVTKLATLLTAASSKEDFREAGGLFPRAGNWSKEDQMFARRS